MQSWLRGRSTYARICGCYAKELLRGFFNSSRSRCLEEKSCAKKLAQPLPLRGAERSGNYGRAVFLPDPGCGSCPSIRAFEAPGALARFNVNCRKPRADLLDAASLGARLALPVQR